MKNKRIGILGGMGPGASAYMYKLLISMAIEQFGAKDNDDFPEIILHSIPIPDFISSNQAKLKALDMLKQRVEEFNCTKDLSSLSIACNTAHFFINDLQSISKHPFISMIKEVSESVKRSTLKKIGILATPSTLSFNLYQHEFNKLQIESIIPEKKQIKILEGIIRNILVGKFSGEDRKLIIKIADSLYLRGARGIILGCTELPLIFPSNYRIPVFNSVEILSLALLRKYYKSNTIKEKL